MKPAYNISYRDEIVETQGKLFGRLERENPECDGADFITAYMNSTVRSYIDKAFAVVANMNATELKEKFLSEEGYSFKRGEPLDGLAADWIGQFYAYCQWSSGIESRELIRILPIEVMCRAYPGLHDLSLSLATERLTPLLPTNH